MPLVPGLGLGGDTEGGQLGSLGSLGWSHTSAWLQGLGPGQVGPSGTLCFLAGIDYKTTTILLDGRRVKLELW